ncbi:MAG: chitosanase, partial [Candidatus Nitrotoga sp.]
ISSARSEAVIDIKKTHTDALAEVRQQTERTKKELMAQLSNLEGTSQKIVKEAEAKGKQLQEEAVKLTAQYQILKSELTNTTKLASEVKALTRKVDRLEDLLTADQEQRIRALISTFETGSPEPDYSSVSMIAGDNEGITYGFLAATRGSGNLHSVVASYLKKPGARYNSELYPFLKPLEARDPKLDSNTELRTFLIKAGTDPLMQSAQNELFGQLYFLPAFRIAQQIGIRSPLGIAVVLDSIVHGGWRSLKNATIKQTGGSPVSGIDERIWLKTYLQKRVEYLSSHRSANLHKSAYRPKALLELIEQGNFDLRPPLLIQGIKIEK